MRCASLVHLGLLFTLVTSLACAKPPAPAPTPAPEPEPAPVSGEGEGPSSEGCVAEPGSGQRYVGHSPDTCAVIKFGCEDGEQYFADECGCGCEPTA